ncbi:SDR family oxidoreductase [Amycolatopsis sp. PS_44_ISF1]|uniref:SDR family oxidoreductase n=1 Tax=Amycolatopsis sp. PS_44_ISF1 TaxID=2974917 RepID=UPI0028DF07C8|nr:SDR family oxidoreductase [Amycolatopsis sp. PS_44_ISF1]MDT8913086.1 SDR family oxidoreductase [Amycolatopsis sp. PS_44_ISF1]
MSLPFDLTGRVALVTGSSRGIGLALAEGLAGAGATIVLNGLDAGRLEDTRARLAGRFGDGRVAARAFDIVDEDAVGAAVESIEAEVGPIDVLISNAGFQHREPLLEVSLADWRRVVDTNLTGAFVVGRAVAGRMVRRRAGKIVNICSVQTDLARPTIGPYTAAKGGLRNLTRAMTAEWAGAGLQVNALAPGYIHTEMTQDLVDDETFDRWVRDRTPARRWGTAGDLVGPAVWLSSPASDYVNGQVIFVDGGMTAVV